MQTDPRMDAPSPRVVVIGSGLSAVGAVKALLKQGIRPTVLDWGESLDAERTQLVEALAKKSPEKWTAEERISLDRNHTVNDGSSIPRKLVFGSDYFYGRSRSEAPVAADGNPPPFSYALGGLSAGWGAAVLPPQACDIADWPVSIEEIVGYCERVLEDMPYSAREDGLSLNFPVLSANARALNLSQTEKGLLDALDKAQVLKKDELAFGQARLLVRPVSSDGHVGCQYCGQCMSGCVYKSIYKAGDEIMSLHEQGEIDYVSRCLVEELSENDGKVTVRYFDADGKRVAKEFDKVFLAAGAVNSARVVLNSLKKFDQEVQLKSRGGFVMPVFSLRRLAAAWPNCNTQPGLFLEFRGKGLEHWVHVQISTENELLLQKLNLAAGAKGVLARIKRFIAGHLILAFVNYHSDHAGHYKLWVTSSSDPEKANSLHSRHRKKLPQLPVLLVSSFRLLRVFVKAGCLPLFPLARLNSGAYHVGGTLPMKEQPSGDLDTDFLGRVGAWKNVHVVDTSIFPSLPGTTVGLLTMANAYRIVDKIEWPNRTGSPK